MKVQMVCYKSKFSKQLGVEVAKLARKTAVAQVLSWDAHALLRCQILSRNRRETRCEQIDAGKGAPREFRAAQFERFKNVCNAIDYCCSAVRPRVVRKVMLYRLRS